MEDLPHIDTSEVIADGVNPDEPRVIAVWHPHPVAGSTETPIHINMPPFRGVLKPEVDTLMPECVAQMLVESGYDVEVKFDAIVNPGFDAEIEAAIEQVEASAAALAASRATAEATAKLSLKDLLAELPNLDLNALRFLLEAETRASAITAIEAAIDTHPEQVAALAAAANDTVTNEHQAS